MTTSCVEPLYLVINKINESKDTLKKYKELWSKIRNLIRSITNSKLNTDNYDGKYLKINSKRW